LYVVSVAPGQQNILGLKDTGIEESEENPPGFEPEVQILLFYPHFLVLVMLDSIFGKPSGA